MASPNNHAFLSPSTSHRWLNCTPSAMLESLEPASQSTFAQEGTEAHALAEIKLSYALGYINDDQYAAEFDTFRLNSKYYNEEFNEYVNSYVTEVMNIYSLDYNKEVKVYLEERVEFSDIVPNGSGTSDVVMVGKDFIHIIDLKFGKGVPVSAVDNPQLKLYALGAIRQHLRDVLCKEVRMTIIQPRLNDITTDFISITTLNDWAINTVRPKATLAIAGQGDLVAGEHCKFCKCRGKCQALADKQLAIAQKEFEDVVIENKILKPCDMTPEMLAKALEIAPLFIDWFKEVQNYATKATICDGLKIPGYKIVEGRSIRQIINPEAIKEKLHTNGYAESDYMKPAELLGIGALEKNIGKKVLSNLCGEYIIKPAGKLTLVPNSDKREAIDVKSRMLTGDEFFNNDVETDDQ